MASCQNTDDTCPTITPHDLRHTAASLDGSLSATFEGMTKTASYVLVQVVLFAAKFVIYEKWVFAGESRLRAAFRSRRQVWTAARANRTP